MMISNELLERYHLKPLSYYLQTADGNEQEVTKAFYSSFLIQTDYVPNKIIEAQALGKEVAQDYTEVLEAREFARNQL